MFLESLKITVFGIAIVFVMLILIICAIKLIEPVKAFFALIFRPITKLLGGKKKDDAAKQQAKAEKEAIKQEKAIKKQEKTELKKQNLAENVASTDASQLNAGNTQDPAVIAAIIAAIEACTGLESRQFVLRSIRKGAKKRPNNLYM